MDSAWHIEYLGDRFKVDESSITVKWKPGVDSLDIDAFLKKMGAIVVRRNILGYVDLRIPLRGDFIPMLRTFISSELIEIAEPNSFGKPASTFPLPRYSNDPYRGNQWYLDQTNNVDINAPQAWGYTTGSPSVVVALLDAGYDWRHEDIGKGSDSYENVWLNPGEDAWSDPDSASTGNHIDDDDNGYVDDWKGWNFGGNFGAGTNDIPTSGQSHGTVIAGIICAKTNNNKGISGVAGGWNGPGVKLLFAGVAQEGGYATELVPHGILYAVARGAKIITMCFYMNPTSPIDAALQHAYNSGCVVVTASGNIGPCDVQYPGNRPTVIAVSGIKKDGTAYPSCTTGLVGVSISAPAGTLSPSDPLSYQMFSTWPDNQYNYILGGTSFAAPQVAAAAALLFSIRPMLTPQQVRCILEKTADDMGTPGYDATFGWGRLNAFRALQATTILLISPAHNSTTFSQTVSLSWTQLFGVASYRVQVATTSSFANPAFDQSGITITSATVGSLSPYTDYFWRVRPDNDICNIATWTETWKFTTGLDTVYEIEKANLAPRLAQRRLTYQLVQNYPNPLNPKTDIRYQIADGGYVTLAIYDVLGRVVATLVNETRGPGEYVVSWDASFLPSGVYYYHLVAGRFFDVKKMLLAR